MMVMKQSMKKIMYACAFLLTCVQVADAMNIFEPFDSIIRPDYNAFHRFQWALLAETGFGDTGFDCDGGKVNVLRIWDCDQNALAMLKGFREESIIGQKRVQVDANDDGVRGHFDVCADLHLKASVATSFRYFFLGDWSIGLYMPFYAYELDNVSWRNRTLSVTDEDRRVREFLTNNFFANVCALGKGLDLTGWSRAGTGDATLLLEWFREFPQQKQLLKNVRINWRFGVSMPTGYRADEDKLFAFAFGNDGAFAFPFGLGIDLIFSFYLRAGFDVQLTHIFGNTRDRRIKTDETQTEHLLLLKTPVHKDFGLTQRFNLYAQLYRIYKGLSFTFGYQFKKRGEDVLSLSTSDCSLAVANASNKLKEWTMHHVILKAEYDFGDLVDPESRIRPQLALFARLPFNGNRVAANSAIGGLFSIDF